MDQKLFVAATFSVSVVLISIFWHIKTLQRKTPPLPPGPRGLPILGYLPFLGDNLINPFTTLGQKYGPIFKLYLGNKLCVVISSPSLVKEVVRTKDAVFGNRDAPIAAVVGSYGRNDIAFSDLGPQWRSARKIFAQEMMSNTSLDASHILRKDVVRKAITQLHGNDTGKPVEIGELSFRSSISILMNMLWGGTLEGEEAEKIGAEFWAVVAKVMDLPGKPNISDCYPILARFDIQGIRKQMETYMQSVDIILESIISQHKKKLCGDQIKKQGKKDFLQILLELQKNEDSEMSISHTQIKAILTDIVSAGTDSTATTIEWAMAALMNNPTIMSKVQKELSDVVGLDDIVEEFHIPKLKYLKAVVQETLRLYPPAPLLLPRRSPAESSTIGGYTIPKNTAVFLNALVIHRDPSIWDNPMEFRPERFLDDNGKWDFTGNNFHYLPFGSGRRICAGMPLADIMLMYLLASLLHSFDWKLPQGEPLDMSETFGVVFRKATPLFGIPTPRLSSANLYA